MSKATTHIELEVAVDYDFQPEEAATREYPGCTADLTVNTVMLGGINIKHELNESDLTSIWEHCMECEVKDPDHL